MRRVITTLAILFVVVVAGMTALVMLVNPNDFRAYMVHQVEQRSGYQLHVSGDLRWHVWPKLSILAGRMSLTAPGAPEPVVAAENMRLDVNLLPLLSHQLSVSQVMLKNAVIRVTPDSEARKPKNAPVGPQDSAPSSGESGWSFDIGQLNVADSLLIWQQPGGDEIHFRNLNLNLEQDSRKQAAIEMSVRMSRNQRNADLSLKGQLDAANYPHRLSGEVEELNYALSGADLPAQGVKGKLSLKGEWNGDTQRFRVPQLQISANDSALQGSAEGSLNAPQSYALNLHAAALNLDNLLSSVAIAPTGEQRATVAHAPVIAEPRVRQNEDSPLNAINLAVTLGADHATWRGLALNDVQLAAASQRGLITLNTFQGQLGAGHFSLPGAIDLRQPVTHVTLQPELNQIAIQPLLKALALPESLQGELDLSGQLEGDELSVEAASLQWQGNAQVALKNARLTQFNLQQLVRRAVERASNRVNSDAQDEQGIDQLSGQAELNHGVITFKDLNGKGNQLALQGGGQIKLTQRMLDVTLGVTLGGWKGDEKLAAALSQQAIPLHMYGSWDNVQYTLPVDQVLRQQLQDEAKSRLNQWLDRQPQNDKTDDLRKLLHP
ncbi:outer membrane assembly protein AsmA [Pantoea sp.]|uniref:outer membrane assembly protein AsmA n=1 Tax=Pantoea sp. TaxID=69393 RepID=UPI0028972675|nr:outer membrane assembly protein AsmA [Pantoea sp.]